MNPGSDERRATRLAARLCQSDLADHRIKWSHPHERTAAAIKLVVGNYCQGALPGRLS